MPISEILYTPKFAKNFKKIPTKERAQVKQREQLFKNNPFDPKLKTHKLKGKLGNYWSFSITHSYRLVFRFLKNDKALFVDVGAHKIYK